MKKIFLLLVLTFLLEGTLASNTSVEHRYIIGELSGGASFNVLPNSEIVYHITTYVDKKITIRFNVEQMGSMHIIYVKDNGPSQEVYYEGNGYAGWEKTITTSNANGRVMIGYKNTDGGMKPTVHFDFYTEGVTTFDESVGIGMRPEEGTRFAVQGNSYLNGHVGINTKARPDHMLDVNGSIRGNSLRTHFGSYYTIIRNVSECSVFDTNTPYFFFEKPLRVSGGIGAASGNLYLQTSITTRMTILSSNGNVGIGTTNPQNKLDVNGVIRAKEIKVETGWADHVFADDYPLRSLDEVKAHIKENKHLPDIPSEAEVKEKGVGLGEMQVMLLQKIEEMTLYMIKQQEKMEEMEKEIILLKNK